MLTSLTADFDEKMKLLLDPNYSGGSQSDTSSVQSTPSKYANKMRRVSEQPPRRNHQNLAGTASTAVPSVNSAVSKTNRSISLGEDSQNVCSEKQLSILNEQQQRTNKKSELKRGRLVDKHHPPKRALGDEDDLEDIGNKENLKSEDETGNNQTGSGNNRVKLRNRRLRRRHTVGGTKDFADIELEAATANSGASNPTNTSAETENILPTVTVDDFQTYVKATPVFTDFHHPALSQYHHSVMVNVDRSLGHWIRRHQKMGKSSPDLSLIGRRLSLPDSVLASTAASGGAGFYPFTSLLESQV